ncbi:MAG: hypothetical protein MK009_09660 [Gammaproteobacteria bacterium]|nr:hypothetical protein [Gammaproteobacteria bacterium]MDC3266774.1 hypothetical protein [Gammaproteobacteria bacterium]
MKMFILDPTAEVDLKPISSAPRLKSPDKKIVGLLSNGKAAVSPFFNHLEKMLEKDWNAKTILRYTKINYSAPADPDLIRELSRCHMIVTGIGD